MSTTLPRRRSTTSGAFACDGLRRKRLTRQLDGNYARHDIPVELLEALRVIGMPDDMERGLVSVFDVRQKTRLPQVGQDELEIALLRFRQPGGRHVERPAEGVQWIRRLVFESALDACHAEASAAGEGGSMRVI